MNGESWKKVITDGSLENILQKQTAIFNHITEARFFKMVVKQAVNNSCYASVGELSLIPEM